MQRGNNCKGRGVWAVSALIVALWGGIAAAQEDTVLIGLNMPLSGSYQDQGEDQLRAYRLAVDEINQQGGVLGKKIVYEVKDTQTKADVAAQNAAALYDAGAVMVTGGSSSAEAIEQGKIAKQKQKIFMVGLSHSDATTGFEVDLKTGAKTQEVNRYMFRWYNNAHMTAKAMVKTLLERFGTSASYYYITADYTWGWSVERAVRSVLEKEGGKTLGAVLVPLGERSFVPYLLQAKMAKPDVLVVVEFGRDMINCLKQANSMGLHKEMKIVVPLMELYMAKGTGADYLESVICTEVWVWQLMDKYPGSKEFVDKFQERYQRYPGSAAAAAWVAVRQWSAAAARAGTFDAPQVAKALEGHKFTLLKDEEQWRDWDHQCVTSTVVMEGKAPADMKNEWDFFNILAIVPGSESVISKQDNPVVWKEQW